MQDQGRPKKGEYVKHNSYSYRAAVTLTKPEGEALDKILADNGCKNLSQFCKKIVHGEPVHW